MPLPLLFALALMQEPTTPPAQEPTNFNQSFEVLETQRLALTPKVDGRIEEEEWDSLGDAGPGKSFFQWEPNKIHVAARVPEGRDLLVSLDLRSNGWLIGSDNLQFRVSSVDGRATVVARMLDATRAAGPTWVDIPGFTLSSEAAARNEDGFTVYEMTATDPGIGILPSEPNAKLSLRVDAPLTTEPSFEPFLPRVVSPVNLVLMRAAALPNGLKYNVEGAGRPVTPGETIRLRLTFNGNDNMKLSKLAVRSSGLARDVTNKIEFPFPRFDSRGRAFVDYDTSIAADALTGYRTLRAELTSADGITSFMEASYQITPPVTFEIVRQRVGVSQNDRSQKFGFYMRSTSGKRLTGTYDIEVPSPLRVLNGTRRDLRLAGRQVSRDAFDVFIPQNTVGTFPVKFKGTIQGQTFEQVAYFTVGG